MRILIFFLFLFIFSFYASSQGEIRIVDFNATIVSELNAPLVAAIERHIKVSKARKIKDKNDYFIVLKIYPDIQDWQIPKNVFDSIYAVNDFHSKLPIDSLTPVYGIYAILACKKYFTHGWMGWQKNTYYFKYNNYDVLINSYLDLIFKTEGDFKQITLSLKIISENKKQKRQFIIDSKYTLWNTYITEVRYKDLISPIWTGKRNEFK